MEAVLRHQPDVVLMDVEMPVLDGFAATERIMAVRPTPIVVVTSRANRDEVRTAFEAVRRGAVEVLAKPSDPAGWEHLSQTLPHTVRLAAGARARSASSAPPASAPPTHPELRRGVRYVAVGASTGGPQAVHELLTALPADPPATVLIVQHIAAGFEEGFADWLAKDLGRDVKLAVHGEAAARARCVSARAASTCGSVRTGRSCSTPRPLPGAAIAPRWTSCSSPALPRAPGRWPGCCSPGWEATAPPGSATLRRAGGWTMVQDEAQLGGLRHAQGRPGDRRRHHRAAAARAGRLLTRCWHGDCP